MGSVCVEIGTLGLMKKLIVVLFVSFIVGVTMGLLLRLRSAPYSTRELLYLGFPGEILMNMLMTLSLPLVITSLISGLTSIDLKVMGKLGLWTFVYFITTTVMAVIEGILIVVIIRPGVEGGKPHKGSSRLREVVPSGTLIDLIRHIFPSNLVEVAFQKTVTELNIPGSGNGTETEKIPVLTTVKGTNMLGVVTISVATSIAINILGPRGDLLRSMIDSFSEMMLVLIHAVIWYSPVGIVFLVVREIVAMEEPVKRLEHLYYYLITVMVGLVLHGFLVLPVVYLVVCRSNPFRYLQGLMQALVTAMTTASSLATLPVTMQNLEENGIDTRVIAFVAPVGATINMDGTALYQAVAVIFIMQVEGHDVGLGKIVITFFATILASVSSAGVPEAGLVTMVMVLSTLGLPAHTLGAILPIDWMVDHYRTAINVIGDAFGAAIVQHLCRDDLKRMTQLERDRRAAGPQSQHRSLSRGSIRFAQVEPAAMLGRETSPTQLTSYR